jgi:hypothetical protein
MHREQAVALSVGPIQQRLGGVARGAPVVDHLQIDRRSSVHELHRLGEVVEIERRPQRRVPLRFRGPRSTIVSARSWSFEPLRQ